MGWVGFFCFVWGRGVFLISRSKLLLCLLEDCHQLNEEFCNIQRKVVDFFFPGGWGGYSADSALSPFVQWNSCLRNTGGGGGGVRMKFAVLAPEHFTVGFFFFFSSNCVWSQHYCLFNYIIQHVHSHHDCLCWWARRGACMCVLFVCVCVRMCVCGFF